MTDRGPGAAIVGSGFGLRVMLPCMRAAGFDIRAICSRNPARIETEARTFGVPLLTADFHRLLDDSATELVCVTTEPSLHADLAIGTLQAEKHLLCEKPLARSAGEAQRIASAAAGRPGVHAVDHELRFHPNFLRIRDTVRSGEIGSVRHIQIRYSTATRVDPALPWTWWADAGAGGGQLNAIGSHMVDSLRWWLGDEIESARGTLAVFNKERCGPDGRAIPVTADEYAAFQMRFAGGAVASVVLSAVDPTECGLRVEIVGSEAALILDGFDSLQLIQPGAAPRDISVGDSLLGQGEAGLNSWRTSLLRYGRHLVSCIREEAEFAGATLEDGVRTQTALDSVRDSARVT